MRLVSFGLMALLSVSLVGCRDFTSPEGVITTAFVALQKSDMKGFRKTLTQEAIEQLGSFRGASEVQDQIYGREMKLGEKRIISGATSVVPMSNDEARIEVYSIDIQARHPGDLRTIYEVALVAEVECQVTPAHSRGKLPKGDASRYCLISKLTLPE